ncbi:hypothetical protein [Paenibacillus sp. L3-i20]|nr:hypothetical protein [Paenibacillus sp. L3-i20]
MSIRLKETMMEMITPQKTNKPNELLLTELPFVIILPRWAKAGLSAIVM